MTEVLLDSKEGMQLLADFARAHRAVLNEAHEKLAAKHGVPYTAFKYAENTGQMAPIREQAGTFADSIKLWSAA